MISGCSHGEAVSIGTVFALNYSVDKDYMERSTADRIIKLIKFYDLPLRSKIDPDRLIEKISHDKKAEKDVVNFVFCRDINDTFTEKVTLKEIKEFLIRSN